MDQFTEIAKTVARVFAGTLLAAVITAILDGVNVISLDWQVWQPFVLAAVVAAGTVIVNALNPSDTRYGLGSGS